MASYVSSIQFERRDLRGELRKIYDQKGIVLGGANSRAKYMETRPLDFPIDDRSPTCVCDL